MVTNFLFALLAMLLGYALWRQMRLRASAEKAVRNGREELIAAQRAGKIGNWSLDMTTGKAIISEQTRRILELPDTTGFPSPREALATLLGAAEAEAVLRARGNGASQDVLETDRRMVASAGNIKWVRIVTEVSRGDDGQALGCRGTVQDITGIRQAQERLAESERDYRLLSESMRDLVCLLSVDGTLFFASGSYARVTGHAADRLLGTRFYDHIHPDEVAAVRAKFEEQLCRKAQELQFEFRFRHREGHYLWLECQAVSVPDESGRIRHIQVSSHDSTSCRIAVDALRESEEKFRRLTEVTADWYWETDGQYRLTKVNLYNNLRAADLKSYILGMTPWESPFNRAPTETWAAHREIIAAQLPFKDLILEYIDPASGELLEYQCLSGEPIFTNSGGFQGYHGTGRFITQQKRQEIMLAERTEELSRDNARLNEEAQKSREVERNVLIAIEMELTRIGLELHDELGQNLTGIALLAKTLGDRITEKRLPESGDAWRVLGLVNDTIRQVRVIAHGLSPHITGTDGLADALRQLAYDINSLGVVTCQYTHDPGIHLDDDLVARGLYRIAQEAVNNALKHSQAKLIVVALNKSDEDIHLRIDDDGVGIRDTDRDMFGNSILHSIKYRAGAIGADLKVSSRETGGTSIAVIYSTRRQPPRRLRETTGREETSPWSLD
jgi:PAS domain S-box-containing protein